MQLNKNIKIIRKLYGGTQQEFADAFTGITLGKQKSYESKTQPGPLYMQELADLTGLSHNDLINKVISKKDIPPGKLVNKENKANLMTDSSRLAEEMLTQKAVTKMLLEQIIKLTAKVYGRALEDVAEELHQNTRLKEIDLRNRK